MKRLLSLYILLILMVSNLMITRSYAIVPYVNILVSKSASGTQGNASSSNSDLGQDGTYVAFRAVASNLVPNDTNNTNDIFVKNMTTGAIERVSVSSNGVQSNSYSEDPSISSNGRYVTFYSNASNLVTNDNNGTIDVFLRDRSNNTTELISVATNGFSGNGASQLATVSGDGRYVVFTSSATNLTPGTNPSTGIYLRDRNLGITTRITPQVMPVSTNATQAVLSCDGKYVVYSSNANNIVPNDNNGKTDIFLYNTNTGGTTNITQNGNDNSGTPNISCNGSTIAFYSAASNLVANDNNGFSDIFIYDLATSSTSLASLSTNSVQGNGNVGNKPGISGDGRLVAFNSVASNLVSSDTNGKQDTFLRDRALGTLERVTQSSTGQQANGDSAFPTISDDGSYISFTTTSNNLVSGDLNASEDVFLAQSGADYSPPNVTGAVQFSASAFGWFNQAVTINWTATDASGTPTQPADTLATIEGTNSYISGQSCDSSGNCSSGTLTVSIDSTLPSITSSVSAQANSYGWYNQDVTVSFDCSDALSGIYTCTNPSTLGEGANQSVSGSAVDKADNQSVVSVTGINVDKSAPTISPALSAAVNAHGWFNHDVTVSFNCHDLLSGVLSCGTTVTLGEGADQSASGVVSDRAFNTNSTAITGINIDKTAPTISASLNATANSYGWFNADVTASFSCGDLLSGILSCTSPITLGEGQNQTANGTSTDNADNQNITSITAINIDKTPSIVANLTLSNTLLVLLNNSTTVTADTSDGLSGIVSGELFIDTDPGIGNGTAMTYANGQINKTLTLSGLSIGNHTINVRSQDKAGNWSSVQSASFFYLGL